jgi:Flp pilus assembly protein TadD
MAAHMRRPIATSLIKISVPLMAVLLLSGCAKSPSGFLGNNEVNRKDEAAAAELVGGKDSPDGAKAYWGTALAKNPRDEKAAISYARALKRESKEKAMGVLQQAAMYSPDSRLIASEQGRLAVDLGQLDLAEKLIARAEDPAKPDWRLVSARGTIAAKRGDNKTALAKYLEAQALAPKEPSVLNNLALAYALEGQATKSESLLRQAQSIGGDAGQVRQNLALVLGVQGKFDEAKQVAVADLPQDTAVENVAYLQRMAKAAPVATAATTQVASVKPATVPMKKLAAAKPAQPLKGPTAPAVAEAESPWSPALAQSAP